MAKALDYKDAYAELEKLVEQMEGDDIQIDSLVEKIKKANTLIAICEDKLRSIGTQVSKEIKPAK